MTNNKSQWPKPPENYQTLPINQQLLLTKNATEAVLNHLRNGPNNSTREHVPRTTAEALLSMVTAVVTKAINQPDNQELLAAVLRVEQSNKRIEGDVVVLKNATETASKKQGPMNVWAKGLSVASPPIAQSTMTPCSSQPAPPPGIDTKENRQILIKLKNDEVAQKYRSNTSKQLQDYAQIQLSEYPTLKAVEIEVAKQLQSGDLQFLMKTRGDAETLKNAKEAKTWVACFGKNAFVLIPTFGVVVHNVSTRQYEFPRDADKLAETIKTTNQRRIPNAEIRHVGWLDKNKIKNPSVKASAIVVEFTDALHADAARAGGLSWLSPQGNEHHDCEPYIRESRAIRCFKCQKLGHITSICKAKVSTCSHCAQEHDSRTCGEYKKPGFKPKCANCQGQHETYNEVCKKLQAATEKAALKRRGPQGYHLPNGTGSQTSTIQTPNPDTNQDISQNDGYTIVKPRKTRKPRAKKPTNESRVATSVNAKEREPTPMEVEQTQSPGVTAAEDTQPGKQADTPALSPEVTVIEGTQPEDPKGNSSQRTEQTQTQTLNTEVTVIEDTDAPPPQVTNPQAPKENQWQMVKPGKRGADTRSPLNSPNKDRHRKQRLNDGTPLRTPLAPISQTPNNINTAIKDLEIPDSLGNYSGSLTNLFEVAKDNEKENQCAKARKVADRFTNKAHDVASTRTTRQTTTPATPTTSAIVTPTVRKLAARKASGSLFQKSTDAEETPAQKEARKSYAVSLRGSEVSSENTGSTTRSKAKASDTSSSGTTSTEAS